MLNFTACRVRSFEVQQLQASCESIKGQVELLVAELILQRKKDEESRKKETVEAMAKSSFRSWLLQRRRRRIRIPSSRCWTFWLSI